MTYATYNITDDRLRLSLGAKPSSEQVEVMRKIGFSYWPGQKLNVTKWTPEAEDYILGLGIEIEADDTPDDVGARVDRFSGYAENAKQSAEAAGARAHGLIEGIPLGQPSARRHGRTSQKRVDAALKTAISETERAAHWKSRIAGAIGRATYRERPDVIARRIKGLETDERAYIFHTSDERKSRMREYDQKSDEAAFTEKWETHFRWATRWLEHIRQRLEYERALLEAMGGQVGCKWELEVGGRVKYGGGWATILRINRKGGEVVSVTTNARFSRVKEIGGITDYRPPTPEENEKAKAATKKPPLCNYPGEGFHRTTKAEWDKCHSNYKGMRRVIEANDKHAKHRVRTMIVNHQYPSVFITDIKETWPPAKE